LDIVGAEYSRDIEPGEVISIDHHGIRSNRYSQYQRHLMCAMEYIYFARPDSDIEGCNVHSFRKLSGRYLYEQCPTKADVVIGVPDSSISAAIGYSEASGIPYEMGLIKNKYIARTFIQPSQEMREKGVRMKLSAVRSLVNGKSVVLIDDSIVRGTTSLRIVRLLKEAGAKRALRLPVGGAFHSPLMEPARQELEAAIAEAQFMTPSCPVYQNVDAQPYTDAEDIKRNLIAQLTAPVRWTQIVEKMLEDGVTEFTEVGPGNVLKGLISKGSTEVATESKSTL
jgi:amidophosphoribosyltransferase